MALEALHKQVLPFLLRRLKEDVLNDLPPKIIQDYYCELSELQKCLYDNFSNSKARTSAEDTILTKPTSSKEDAGQQHIFQSLQYLRKLCNHPALILKTDQAAISAAFEKAGLQPVPLSDIQQAPKLLALKYVRIHALSFQSYIQHPLQATSDRLWDRYFITSPRRFNQKRSRRLRH